MLGCDISAMMLILVASSGGMAPGLDVALVGGCAAIDWSNVDNSPKVLEYRRYSTSSALCSTNVLLA